MRGVEDLGAALRPHHAGRVVRTADAAYRDLLTPTREPNAAALASLIRWGVPIAEAVTLAEAGDGPACAAAIRKHAGRI